MRKTLKKIWIIIANVILALLVLVGIFIAVSLLPIKNNYKIMAVMSGSMEPGLHTGSIIIVQPKSLYSVGDIITFHTPGSNKKNDSTTHRIYAEEDDLITTKGDANNAPDSAKIHHNDIIGKSLFSVPFMGYIISYVKTLPGLVLIIIIPATIIIYEEIRKMRNEAREIIKRRRDRKKAVGEKSQAEKKNVDKHNVLKNIEKVSVKNKIEKKGEKNE